MLEGWCWSALLLFYSHRRIAPAIPSTPRLRSPFHYHGIAILEPADLGNTLREHARMVTSSGL